MSSSELNKIDFAKCLTGETALAKDLESSKNGEIALTCFRCGFTLVAKIVNDKIQIIGAPNSPIITDAKVVKNPNDDSYHIQFSCGYNGERDDRPVQDEMIE